MSSNIFHTGQFYGCDNLENLSKKSGFYGDDQEWGDISDMDMDYSYICGQPGLIPMSKNQEVDQRFHHFPEFGTTNPLLPDIPPQISSSDIDSDQKKIEPAMNGPDGPSPSTASFEILKKFKSRCRRINGSEILKLLSHNIETTTTSCGLEMEMIIKLAAERFIQHTTCDHENELSVLSHPYPESIMCSSEADYKGVQLVQNLLSCAQKIGEKQYDRARELLLECDKMSSPKGTPVERLVYYFTEALYEKIDRETGGVTPKGLGKKVEDPLEVLKSPSSTMIAFHKELPLSQITKFSGVQAVVDNLNEARKVHFVDFELRKGVQCTILMQALAARCGNPIEHLKISAVGTKSRESIEETGRQLAGFAETLNFTFSFKVVMVEDILDLDQTLFEIEPDEAVAVYAAYTLTSMIARPCQLEHAMSVITRINPCVMVVTEVEANINSPIFVDRFVEALIFYGALFESMADCMKHEEAQRHFGEATCFGSAIRNIVATEGDERKIRHVSIEVWRAFFTRYGFEETELSMSSVYQADLVLGNFISGDSYNFDKDGKSLIVCWKGTPVSSLSAWRIQSS